ncbi:MAG: SpoIID/LytB domain-containing protein [Anaerolineae bacterium]|nr:SpoIID/LytB domain-containing protein [Anaerolineae bacterium]
MMPLVAVQTVDFKQYIKNVLPNEWPSSWHPESLKAGAVAAKMFAWWRYNILEQFPQYRPQGVHVVNNVCDQVYIAGRSAPSTDAAVDATWPYRMTDNERVVEIHYLAWDWQCANAFTANGGGWRRCMGQNESNQLANSGWDFQGILQRYYAPVQIGLTKDMPVNVNVLKNGTFDADLLHWFAVGGVGGVRWEAGALRFFRAVGSSSPAQVYQDADVLVNAASPLSLRLGIGNPTTSPKMVRVRLMTPSGAVAVRCDFTVSAGAPPLTFTVSGATPSAWTGVRVQVSSMTADGLDGVLLDNASLSLNPAANLTDPCQPPRPGRPRVSAPASAAILPLAPVTVSIVAGASNHIAGYAPAWHVQIDDQNTFASPFYDNATALLGTPSLTLNVPNGTWYVRTRQYDGVRMFSNWSRVVSFTVQGRPPAPTLIAPVGDVPAQGQSFIWSVTDANADYVLIVRDAAGVELYRARRNVAGWGCVAGICSASFASIRFAALPDVSYRWQVMARNSVGQSRSPWSDFRLVNVTLRQP